VVNENDVISTDEINEVFGDNDKLSALVASKMDADLLILLTDVDGLYDRNPETDRDAKLIPTVDEVTKDIERIAGSNRNGRSTGGMRTKINAAKIAMQSGCNMVIANGREKDVIQRVAGGEELGTLFTARSHYTNRERWILFACPRGKIVVDEGAEKALRDGRSLLPCGIVAVEGRFKKGDVVRINAFGKGLVNHSVAEVQALVQTCQEEKVAGRNGNGTAVVSHENIVLLE
jgi:glutamate 5-kinase